MIHFSQMTGNERDVLHAALKAYDVEQAARLHRSKLRMIEDDVRWRRYIVASLLEQMHAK